MKNVRKPLCALIVLALLMSILSVGIAEEKQETSGIVRGGTITIAKSSDITVRNFDLTQSTNAMNDFFVHCQIFESLINIDAEGNFVPGLATEWYYTEDGCGLVLKLREDVSWSDGTKFNAENCAYVMNYYMTDECNHYQRSSDMVLMTGVDVIDEYTIQLNTSVPDGSVIAVLSGTTFRLMSPGNVANKDCTTKPVGTGPFKLQEYVEGDHITLVANENYYLMGEDGKPLPYLDSVVFKIMTDDSVRIANMRSGDIDGINMIGSNNSVLAAMGMENVKVYQLDCMMNYWLGFNTDYAPLADQRIRLAISYAIDRQEIIDVALEGLGCMSPFYSKESQYWFYDYYGVTEYKPEKAKELLADAGYPDGITLDIAVISREPDNTIIQLIMYQMDAAGITLNINAMERTAWIAFVKTEAKEQLAMGQNNNSGVDLSRQLRDPVSNYVDGSIDEVVKLQEMYTALKTYSDADERYEAVKELQEYYHDNTLGIVLGKSYVYCCFKNNVHGIFFNASGGFDLGGVWLD